MRTIRFTRRHAALLRDNLVNNQDGYDYTDLCRLDFLARKLTTVQAEYADGVAALVREERALRRRLVRAADPRERDTVNLALADLQFRATDLHEEALAITCEVAVEDGDWKLINDKLSSVGRWQANDEVRPLIIGLIEAVRDAESDQEAAEPVKLRKRDSSA